MRHCKADRSKSTRLVFGGDSQDCHQRGLSQNDDSQPQGSKRDRADPPRWLEHEKENVLIRKDRLSGQVEQSLGQYRQQWSQQDNGNDRVQSIGQE